MDKRLIISLSSLVIGVILIFLIIDPLWSSVMILRERVKSKIDEVARIEILLVKKEELEGKYQETLEAINQVSLSLPEGEDISYLISQFDAMASRNGLLIESISFDQIENSDDQKEESQGEDLQNETANKINNLSVLNIDIEMSGSYQSFKGLLNDIENGARLIEVSSMSFSPFKGSTETEDVGISLFNFNLGAIVYYQ